MEVNKLMVDEKWSKYKGIITIDIGGDKFDMLVSNKEIPAFFKLSKEMNDNDNELTELATDLLLNMCKRSLKRANPEVNEDEINAFADANGFKLVMKLFAEFGSEKK